jgi:hypothetical protein
MNKTALHSLGVFVLLPLLEVEFHPLNSFSSALYFEPGGLRTLIGDKLIVRHRCNEIKSLIYNLIKKRYRSMALSGMVTPN